MKPGEAAARLQGGAAELGIDLDDERAGQLLGYLDLIEKWSRIYNLTAVRDPSEMLDQHLLDSLAALPSLVRHTGGRAARVLDAGSGAGLPGVVFAICRPELQVDCVDAVGKKAAFIQQVAAELRLDNLRGLHARVETVAGPYDIVCSRAFASLADFVRWSADALGEGGAWMALKGKRPDAELAELPPQAQVFHVEQLSVPGLAVRRCIVWMRKTGGAAGTGGT